MRRILFVSCNYAADYGPMVWGTYIRMRLLLQAAAHAAEAVDLLLFAHRDQLRSAQPLEIASSIKRHWGIDVTVHVAPRSRAAHGGSLATLRGLFDIRFQQDYGDAGGPEQAAAVSAVLTEETDLVVAHRLDAALAVVSGVAGRVPIAVNFDDIEHVARARRARRQKLSLNAVLQRVGVRAIRRAERGVLRVARSALVCSLDERAHLIALDVPAAVEVIPNAVPFPLRDDRMPTSGKTIMFIGSYTYEPNIDAAEELINAIFPLILEQVPDARLLIAGTRSELLPSARTVHPAVEVLGFVEDVREIYSRADVACCAIRAGGGTRIKIIEAAAWAIPTVSTTLGAEGIDLVDGSEIVLADSARAMADACIRLIGSSREATAMGDAARRKVARHYELRAVVEQLAATYRRTVAGAASPATVSTKQP